MARRKTDPTAPALPLTGGKREPIGTVEKAAASDVRTLRDLELLGAGTDALAAAYRRAGREVDRAERKRDSWAAFAAIRELRSTRVELGPIATPLADGDLEELLAMIVDELRQARPDA